MSENKWNSTIVNEMLKYCQDKIEDYPFQYSHKTLKRKLRLIEFEEDFESLERFYSALKIN